MFIAQYNKDNVALQGKVWAGLLYKTLEWSKFKLP